MKESLTYKHVFDSTSNGVIATDTKYLLSKYNALLALVMVSYTYRKIQL